MKKNNAICAIILSVMISGALVALVLSTEEPIPTVIDENATFTGYIEREGDFRFHSIRVFENVTGIHLVLNCPGNDFDLYGRMGNLPSTIVYDFRGYESGGENIQYDAPEAGIWHLMVRSFSGIGHYDLIIEFEYD